MGRRGRSPPRPRTPAPLAAPRPPTGLLRTRVFYLLLPSALVVLAIAFLRSQLVASADSSTKLHSSSHHTASANPSSYPPRGHNHAMHGHFGAEIHADAGFCQGHSAMYHSGFRFTYVRTDPPPPCLNLFFESWTLDTPAKFWWGMFFLLILSAMVEGLSAFRRGLRRWMPHGAKRKWLGVATHGTQAMLGYILMMGAMTYSVELFFSIVAGTAGGYAAFFNDWGGVAGVEKEPKGKKGRRGRGGSRGRSRSRETAATTADRCSACSCAIADTEAAAPARRHRMNGEASGWGNDAGGQDCCDDEVGGLDQAVMMDDSFLDEALQSAQESTHKSNASSRRGS